MVIVALDVGQARIGVAASDETEVLATPVATVKRRSDAAAIAAIARIVGERGAGLVVVGLPVSFDGQLHEQARSVQRFAEKLRAALAVPFVYADETLSTVRAEERLREAGVRSDKIRERIDAVAAALILEEYLDLRRRLQAGRPSAASEEFGDKPLG
ncbi:MAG TPA: Holliday junction resolvase RuvX [Ktedonobacterales bacterium]|jgi:putative holliday junction resolvase|nr:Holliday junction resolvase RuvX [Ktedonobacterales bacterium]